MSNQPQKEICVYNIPHAEHGGGGEEKECKNSPSLSFNVVDDDLSVVPNPWRLVKMTLLKRSWMT